MPLQDCMLLQQQQWPSMCRCHAFSFIARLQPTSHSCCHVNGRNHSSVRVRACRIVDGPVRVELQRTLHTNVPGVAFGVSAEAFSNQDDSPVKGEGCFINGMLLRNPC
jgi:hypothetical protein